MVYITDLILVLALALACPIRQSIRIKFHTHKNTLTQTDGVAMRI